MKIIDLLNIWVEDRNKLPKKIKVDDEIYVYDKQTNLYKIPKKKYFLISDYLDCIEKIYENVEVIEENKEIDIQAIKEISSEDRFYRTDNIDKLNELTRAIKQIDKELNELKSLDYLEISERDINDAIKKAREYMYKEREEK